MWLSAVKVFQTWDQHFLSYARGNISYRLFNGVRSYLRNGSCLKPNLIEGNRVSSNNTAALFLSRTVFTNYLPSLKFGQWHVRRISILTNIAKFPWGPSHPAIQFYTVKYSLLQSGEMEASDTNKTLSESNIDCPPPVDNSVKETREKRKSQEVEETEENTRGKKRRRGAGKNLRPGERYVPPPQKRNPGVSFSQEHFQETSYYFEGGLRKVHPYYFDFKTYCKGRWIGKTLLDVFSSEFRAESLDYYKLAAKDGRIRLNETPIEDLNITLKNNDFLRNTVHRHEPPVSGRPLAILEDNGEVVVVDKPSSLPVHPCGRFRHNTVIFILGKERGLCGLHTVHRLDRLTSGVLLFARTLEVSKRLDQLVRDRQMEKEYVCRVAGEFPEQEVVCEEPILVVSFKVGVCRVDPKGKFCRTVFQRLSWNGRSSVVRCLPLTGRTHQIRVHLQFLGHPIVNDPIYGSAAWGPHRAKGGQVDLSDEQLLEALLEEHRSKESLHLLDLPDDALVQRRCVEAEAAGDFGASESGRSEDASSGERYAFSVSNKPESKSELYNHGPEIHEMCSSTVIGATEPEDPSTGGGSVSFAKDSLCSECKIVRPDPTERELIMYLHALRYKGPGFEYSTPLPDWAREDWVED